jgi:hypothetical protein
VSKYDQQCEHAVEQKDWVSYEIALIFHVETVFKKASGGNRGPSNDSKAEGYPNEVAQIQKD